MKTMARRRSPRAEIDDTKGMGVMVDRRAKSDSPGSRVAIPVSAPTAIDTMTPMRASNRMAAMNPKVAAGIRNPMVRLSSGVRTAVRRMTAAARAIRTPNSATRLVFAQNCARYRAR